MVRLKVKEIAEGQGITSAAELARRSGLAFAKANEIWKGEITNDGTRSVGILVLHRVAKALGVKIADLLDEDRATLRAASA